MAKTGSFAHQFSARLFHFSLKRHQGVGQERKIKIRMMGLLPDHLSLTLPVLILTTEVKDISVLQSGKDKKNYSTLQKSHIFLLCTTSDL